MKDKRGGFSLVELVLVIVVAAIAIPALIMVFSEVSRKGVYDETITIATSLAQGKMEDTLKKDFANITDVNRGSPAAFASPYDSYSWQVRVDAVSTDLAVDAGKAQYKQVQVVVTNSLAGDVTLTNIATNN